MNNIKTESEKKECEGIGKTKNCSKCHQDKHLHDFTFINNKNRYASWCHTCTSEAAKVCRKNKPEYYKKCAKDYCDNHIFSGMRKNMKLKHKKMGWAAITFNQEYLETLWRRQEGRCYWTEMPMQRSKGLHKNPFMVSADRLNCSKGYVQDNIVLCCIWVNLARSQTPANKWRIFLKNELGLPKKTVDLFPKL